MKTFLSVLLILCVTAVMVTALITARDNQQQDRFSVSATGRVFAKPDVANLTIGFKTDVKKTAAEAVNENSEKMNDIIKELKGLDIEAKDIKTSSYNLNPSYNWTQDRGQQLIGYQVYQNVTIKIRDLDKIGQAIAKTTEKGANQVGGVSFTIDDEEELKTEARDEAIARAKEKAEEIAKATGMKLGDVVSVHENNVYYPESRTNYAMKADYGMGGGEEIAMPEIETGENEVAVEVTLVYKVK